MTFPEYVRHWYETDKSTHPYKDIARFYCINGKMALDFVGRFEQLEDDMRYVIGELRLPLDISNFPHAKHGNSTDYRSYYGPEERNLVKDISRWEIETFEYRF